MDITVAVTVKLCSSKRERPYITSSGEGGGQGSDDEG